MTKCIYITSSSILHKRITYRILLDLDRVDQISMREVNGYEYLSIKDQKKLFFVLCVCFANKEGNIA